MSITYHLDEPLASFVTGQVAAGRYASATEAVADALRQLADRLERRRQLDDSILAAIASSEAGDVVDAEDFLDELDAMIEALPETAGV